MLQAVAIATAVVDDNARQQAGHDGRGMPLGVPCLLLAQKIREQNPYRRAAAAVVAADNDDGEHGSRCNHQVDHQVPRNMGTQTQ